MESRYIVAVEIGSSKIKGIAAAVEENSRLAIVAVEETDSADSVRHGRVQNAREVAVRVNDIIRRLENNPRLAKGVIKSVYVSNGGRSVMSSPSQAEITLGGDVEITTATLEKLHQAARYNLATDRDILAISDRRYTVDGSEVKKIVGTFGRTVRGEFTIVTASPENRRNLERVSIESRGGNVEQLYIPRPVALADMLLTNSERQLGCVLIDFGAETTTLAVYRDNALQLMTTLPMGGVNITRDLSTGLGITLENAENIKITKGRAIADSKFSTADNEETEINNYISARTGEIIANVVNYMDHAGIKFEDLPGGVIITGGGAKLVGLAEMLTSQTQAKVRQANIDADICASSFGKPDNADVIALVKYAAAQGAKSCIEFVSEKVAEPATQRPASEAGTGTLGFEPMKVGNRTNAPGLNDPGLLDDDPDEIYTDPPLDDDNDELPPPAKTKDETRQNLMKKLKSFFTKPTDENDLDNENDSENDLD